MKWQKDAGKEDGAPFVFWNNVWSPICGTYYWDNNYGALAVCRKLGYGVGKTYKQRRKYDVKSFKIGKCGGNEQLEACTGGCNDYSLGGTCNGKNGDNCDANADEISVTIECRDPVDPDLVKSSSCDGSRLVSIFIYFLLIILTL